ncbi:MAG: hypothetical protein OXD37_09795 [Acidimicrobiaceae bacterium]|nr:hypothetical protein [Acidimicrobiaceae bacterium]
MPIADRAAALEKLTNFLELLNRDRDDRDKGGNRSALDDIYRYIDAVRSIALAVDIVQFHRISPDESENWDTARIAVLRVIGQLEHAEDMAQILAEDSTNSLSIEPDSLEDESF